LAWNCESWEDWNGVAWTLANEGLGVAPTSL
jgi:hypothetical protein